MQMQVKRLRYPRESNLTLHAMCVLQRWRVSLSFFVVGMSMATFIASALQCMDYLNMQYQASRHGSHSAVPRQAVMLKAYHEQCINCQAKHTMSSVSTVKHWVPVQ